MIFVGDIPIGKTVKLIYGWTDSKGAHKRKLKSAYCFFHYKALIYFSGFMSGVFEALNISDEKCSVCNLEEEE